MQEYNYVHFPVTRQQIRGCAFCVYWFLSTWGQDLIACNLQLIIVQVEVLRLLLLSLFRVRTMKCKYARAHKQQHQTLVEVEVQQSGVDGYVR